MVLAALAFAACSPDDFKGADENGLPSMDGVDFTVSVDQTTNTMTASIPEIKGEYPVWLVNGATYSTLPTVTWSNKMRGDYTVELRMGNRNGFSQSSLVKTFHFNETKVDLAPYLNRLAGKTWRIDNSVAGHLACGQPHTSGTGYWSAKPDEKSANSVYDDRVTFETTTANGGTYTYSSGDDGKTFVNKGTTLWGHQDDDWDATIAAQQQAAFTLEPGTYTDADGNLQDCIYLVLADNTLFPYISEDAQYQHPRFRIEGLTNSALNLVYDNGTIAWHFTLTSAAAVKGFDGFDANSDFNLFKNAEFTLEYYYAPNWAQIANPETENNGNDWIFSYPTATSQQWQNQTKWRTNISTSAANNYDFSVQLTADKDMNGVTVKLTDDADDSKYYFADQINLKAGEKYIFWKSNMPGLDISKLQLVIDAGGNPENSSLEVAKIVLKDHANDDGTVLPEPEVAWCDVNSDLNIGKALNTFGEMTFWWADNSWSQIASPTYTYADGVYSVSYTGQPGGLEWMAQCVINGASAGVPVELEAGAAYDISLKLTTNVDIDRYTLKICQYGNDDNALVYKNDLSASAGTNTVQLTNVTNATAMSSVKLILDFGGIAPNPEFQISDIIIQKHNTK